MEQKKEHAQIEAEADKAYKILPTDVWKAL